MNRETRLAVWVAISASVMSIAGLLSIAFSMANISTPLYWFNNALFFLGVLGGAFLVLAFGLRRLVTNMRISWFLFVFACLINVGGVLLLWRYPRYMLDWFYITLAVVAISVALRRAWLWGVVGGTWVVLVLGTAAESTIETLVSPSSHFAQGWEWIPFVWAAGFILAAATVVVAYKSRGELRRVAQINGESR